MTLTAIQSDHLQAVMHIFIRRDDISQADTKPISGRLLEKQSGGVTDTSRTSVEQDVRPALHSGDTETASE